MQVCRIDRRFSCTIWRTSVGASCRIICRDFHGFPKRPAGGELLSKLRGGDHLCIAKLDRAFRSARDCHNTLAELRERGVTTSVCDLPDGADVTGNGIAALLIGIMASVSEWERERIRERTADQKRLARQQGRFLGGKKPWDMRIERGKLVPDDRKARLVQKIRHWRAEGIPLREIASRVESASVGRRADGYQNAGAESEAHILVLRGLLRR